MDLTFSPEEQAFREEVRSFVKAKLPDSIRHKVVNSLPCRAKTMCCGSARCTACWAAPAGRRTRWPGWNAVEQYIFEENVRGSAPRLIAFGSRWWRR